MKNQFERNLSIFDIDRLGRSSTDNATGSNDNDNNTSRSEPNQGSSSASSVDATTVDRNTYDDILSMDSSSLAAIIPPLDVRFDSTRTISRSKLLAIIQEALYITQDFEDDDLSDVDEEDYKSSQ
jgi:hypothetical protein